MPRLNASEFGRLADALGSDGGFTVRPDGTPVTSGISVAPFGNERKVAPEEDTPSAMAEYTADASNQRKFERGASFGGWRGPDGTDYLDTPTVYPSTPGGMSRARRHEVKAHQIAAFDLDNFQEHFNPFHPEGRQAMGLDDHEIATLSAPRPGDTPEQSRRRFEWAAQQPEVQAWINSPRYGRS